MSPTTYHRIKEVRRTLHAQLSNQMTYPKVLIGLAQNRRLTEEEILLAQDYLEECLHLADSAFTLLLENENNPLNL